MGDPTLYRGDMAKRRYFLLTTEDGKKFPRVDTRSWAFVIVLGALLTVLALLDRGSLDEARADGSTGCQLEVTTDQLNVRAGPAAVAEQVGTVQRGQLLDGTTTVVDGFRELEDGRYVADEFLTPVPGTDCR
jgi:hypothetical protein